MGKTILDAGTCFARFSIPQIDVKIAEGKDFIISATGSYQIKDKKRTRIFHHPVQIEISAAGIKIDGELWQEEIRIESSGRSFCQVNGREYRGVIFVKKNKENLQVINTLSLEEYLYGLIKLEISPEWPLSTLCAQAIVARTYAIRKLWEGNSLITNLPAHQAYGGIKAEDARGRIAVDLTRGEILVYQGEPVNSVYHACSGGYTASSREVWGEDFPYLRAQPDPFSTLSPYSRWTVRISKQKLEEILQKIGLRLKGIKALKILEKDTSGRCKLLLILAENTSQIIPGKKLREIMGFNVLRSTFFQVENEKDEFVFRGKGWGHGVGMSQWGAAKMGKMGYTTEEILRFYYPETRIDKIY